MSEPQDTSPSTEERLAELRTRSDPAYKSPPYWNVETDGDVIVGIFVRLEQGPTRFGLKPIAILHTDEGERSIWMLNEVLRNQFAEAAPQVGDPVCVRYLGKRTSAAGSEYDDYRVVADHGPLGPNWGAVAGGMEAFRAELEEQSRSLEHMPQQASGGGGQR